MQRRTSNTSRFGPAILALILAMPIPGFGDNAPDGKSGHEHGIGKNRLTACSAALDAADRVAARLEEETGAPVDVRPCECEEDPRAPETERYRCLVHWAIRTDGE